MLGGYEVFYGTKQTLSTQENMDYVSWHNYLPVFFDGKSVLFDGCAWTTLHKAG